MNLKLINDHSYRNTQKLNNLPKTKREIFNELIKEFETHNLVLIGLRQVGKTTLAEQIINYFIKNKKTNENNEIFIIKNGNNDFVYLNLKEFDLINKEEIKIIKNDIKEYIFIYKPKYCFIDEIQMMPQWSNFCQTLVDLNKNTKFIFTGSNAKVLSSETMFNRAKIFFIKTLSFYEYKMFWKNDDFWKYLKFGSYPPTNNIFDVETNYKNLIKESIIDKIAFYDSNYQIDLSNFYNFIKKIIGFIGNEIKFKKNFEKRPTPPTANRYANLLVDSKLISKIWKYDDKSNKPLSKLYFNDKSIFTSFLSLNKMNNNEMGSFIENVVFFHLDFIFNKYFTSKLHEGIQYYRNENKKEIDFIIPEHKLLIEVKYIDNIAKKCVELIKKYDDISCKIKKIKDYKKFFITKNFNYKQNNWEFISLENFLEMRKNDLLKRN